MLRRRVPVLRLGSGGPGGDARSLRLRTQASVRNRSQWSASVRGGSDMPASRKSSRNAELSSLFTFSVPKVSTITGIGGVVVAKRRTVVTRRTVVVVLLDLCLRVSKVSTITGIGGVVVAKRRTVVTRRTVVVVTFGLVSSRLKTVNNHRDRGRAWSRNAERSSLLDSSLCASQKRQQSQGSGGPWSRNAKRSSLLDSSRAFASQKCQQSRGIGEVVVAKRRTVVTFGLVSGFRISKVSTITGIGGVVVPKRRAVVTFGLVSVSSRLKSVSSHRDRGGRGRET